METYDQTWSDEEELISDSGEEQEPEETKFNKWDVFQDIPESDISGSTASKRGFVIAIQITKVLAIILSFLLVLVSSVIAKGSLLLMTSQMRKDVVTPYCNKDIDENMQYLAKLPESEHIAWTWSLLFAFLVPEFGRFLRALRICVFKNCEWPGWIPFFVVFAMETLHTIGMALLVFLVLPELDVVRGIMLTNCVCFIPAILKIVSRYIRRVKSNIFYLKISVDCIALIVQLSGFFVWPASSSNKSANFWFLPLALVFISCMWWENFLIIPRRPEKESSFQKYARSLLSGLKQAQDRYYIYLIVSAWKMLLFFGFVIIIQYTNDTTGSKEHFHTLFTNFSVSFQEHIIPLSEIKPIVNGTDQSLLFIFATGQPKEARSWPNAALYVMLIHAIASYLCYVSGKFACKIMIQKVSFALPINIATPATVCLLIIACGLRNIDSCAFSGFMPDYVFFKSPSTNITLDKFIVDQWVWLWPLWLLSQYWITFHIWYPKGSMKLSPTDTLFVVPWYDSFLIDQSLAMNRRQDTDEWDVPVEELNSTELPSEVLDEPDMAMTTPLGNKEFASIAESSVVKPKDKVPRVFACATMWHETAEEAKEMLKSILRMDFDQSARRIAQEELDMVDPCYYRFETHIFFDDAFRNKKNGMKGEREINDFVRILIKALDDVMVTVHHQHCNPPVKYPTPYGGRLVWLLPGRTRLIVHLKDKDKIRHRKRWSQVMYMYYLLGYKLMELPIPVARKFVIAQNTYLLALDGDIDFTAQAVRLLIDLMRKNDTLGAACGRIHPVGAGAMVWYQLFEYAIGHWLQKATEHMIGCVLCSPGCFSLFRARALMDEGVMKRYTKTPEEPRHYVQYDQGEDRWLCTLLLQQGYRVEYCAASDAYTHAPESFNVFYNQRRRWIPSTMANIFDLLGDARKTCKMNNHISMPYIFYQIMLIGGSILGPGTIFLMLVGSFVAAFKIDNWSSFEYNAVPILIFMLVCATCKSKTQLFFAMVISAVYALVMMAVLVGIVLQMNEDGPFAPSSLFFFITAGELIIAAFLHPQEINCLPAGVVYYVTVPSMYMLLIIYSIFNLNDVSWGTREAPESPEAVDAKKKVEEEAKKKKNKNVLTSMFQTSGDKDKKSDAGSLEFSIAGLFSCMLCTHPKAADDDIQLSRVINSLELLETKLDGIERRFNLYNPRRPTLTSSAGNLGTLKEEPSMGERDDEEGENESVIDEKIGVVTIEPEVIKRDDEVDPYWLEDPILSGKADFLRTKETQFWKTLINKYLKPIDQDTEKEKALAKELKFLRNKAVFAFVMLNSLFVLTVFLLQVNKDQIFINWPLGNKKEIVFDPVRKEFTIRKYYLPLEPVGMVFVLFFAIIMIIQFVAMLFHRFSTLSHILADTPLRGIQLEDVGNQNSTEKKDMSNKPVVNERVVEEVKKLQQINLPEDKVRYKPVRDVRRRTTAFHLDHSKLEPRRQSLTLQQGFRNRIRNSDFQMKHKDSDNEMRKSVIKWHARHERRLSQMPANALTRRSSSVSGNHGISGQFNPSYEHDGNTEYHQPPPRRPSVESNKRQAEMLP